MTVRTGFLAGLFALAACAGQGGGETTLPLAFENENRCGYTNARDGATLPARWHVCRPFTPGGIAAIADDSGWYWIDTAGNVVATAFVVDNGPDPFLDDRARIVSADGRIGFIDSAGRVAVPARWDAARPFGLGLAPVCTGCRSEKDGAHSRWTGGKWGYVARDGSVRIAARFDDAWPADPAQSGFMPVRIGDCRTAIDAEGSIAGPPCP